MSLPELKFEGPYSFTENKNSIFKQPTANVSGIYLWTIEENGNHLIYYVGMSSQSIIGRHITHLVNYLGGQYTIADPSKLKHAIYKPIYTPKPMNEFMQDYFNISKYTYDLLKQINIYYSRTNVEKRVLQRIEGAIIESIKGGNTKSKNILDVKKYSLRWDFENESNIQINFPSSSDLPIEINY